MNLTSFTSLKWAYQLHYYLCFRTHRCRNYLQDASSDLTQLLAEICGRHEYSLLDFEPYPDQLRCLLSLQPAQNVAKVVQTIKANASRELSIRLELPKPVWGRGYLARSTGRMRIDAVREYLANQSEHHGYANRINPPVYHYRAPKPKELRSAHAIFDLSHHLVVSTERRQGFFSAESGESLCNYWLRVADARNFAIDQISVVPDHIHSVVRIVPSMSIEECAFLLMNNGQHFMGKSYPEEFVKVGIDQLWQPSAYAGTCGEITTALLKSWLNSTSREVGL